MGWRDTIETEQAPAVRQKSWRDTIETEQAAPKSNISIGQTAAKFAEQGATLGFSDEIKAGLGALYAKSLGGDATKDRSLGQLYDEAITDERAKLKAAKEVNPKTAIGADFLGSLVLPIGAAKGATSVSQLAKVGAGTGFIQGAGHSEAATPGELIEDAYTSAAVGGVVTPAASKTLGAINALFRGGKNPQIVKSNIRAFEAAGTTPTLGQATESRAIRAIESGLSKLPGGAGVFAQKAKSQAQEMGERVGEISSWLSPAASAENAGMAIERGIKKNFLPESRKVQTQLYNELDEFLPAESAIQPTSTVKALDELTSPIEGAASVSKTSTFKNTALNELKTAIAEDLGANGALPYTAMKQFRTRIGEKLEDFELAPNIKRTELKRLYGALSQDMEQAAKGAGPNAYSAFKRANNYTRSLHEQMDILQSVIDKNGGPEKIFKSAVAGTTEGATTFGAVMRSLPSAGKRAVSAAILKRLGKATPGNQDDLGEIFSTQTFLTNWNKLSPEAKQVAFGGYGKKFKEDMDKITKVANNFREGSQVFSNPSGTSNSIANMLAMGVLGGGIGTLNAPVVTAVLAAIAGTNAGSKLLTNPKFVRWAAHNADKPASSIPIAIGQLTQIAINNKDPDMMKVAESMNSLR